MGYGDLVPVMHVDLHNHLIISLRLHPNSFDSYNLDYGTRSLLAFLIARDISTRDTKNLVLFMAVFS